MCWFNYLFPPLEIQLRRFGVRNSTCVLGGEKAGAKRRFPRGCSADTSFLLLASFLPVALGSVCRGWLQSSSCVWICFRRCLPTKSKGPVPETKGPLDWQWLGRSPFAEACRRLLASISAHLGVRILVQTCRGAVRS